MFNDMIKSGNSPFYYLQKYYLAEARGVSNMFSDAIDDIVRRIYNAMSYDTEWNPTMFGVLDYDVFKNEYYTGWSFDTTDQKVIRSKKPENVHPIYLRYFLNPSYDFTFSVEERKDDDYDKQDDPIIINVDIDLLKRNNYSEDYIRSSIIHELTHALQMWVDIPKRMNPQNTAYRNFLTLDFLKSKGLNTDFISEKNLKHIYVGLLIFSDTELEAICEEVDSYIQKHGLEIAMSTDYMTSDTHVDDFLSKYLNHVYNPFSFAQKLLQKFMSIRKDMDVTDEAFRILILFVSAMVDLKLIKDSYHKRFADYKLCLDIQENRFKLDYEINSTIILALDEFAKKLDEYVADIYRAVRDACKKYKIEEILSREIYRRTDRKVKNQWKPLYETNSPILVPRTEMRRNNMYENYMDYVKMKREADQTEYLVESLKLLNDNLFDSSDLQYYGEYPVC